jgi:predicted TIM-barrel fold metal-dependent hydrolase
MKKEDAAIIERLPIATAEKDRILGDNAREFIGL